MGWTVAIGVDTHKDVHVAVALDERGARLDQCMIATTPAGYRELVCWAQRLAQPAFSIEGCGSYGLGLVRFLQASGVEQVFECERPRRSDRRKGKSDLIDATLAARRLVSGERQNRPRGGGEQREQLRLLLAERRGAVRAHTAALNQLRGMIVTAPDELRGRLAPLSTKRLAKTTARLRAQGPAEVIRRTGRRAEYLAKEIREIEHSLTVLLAELAPQLLEECGVGIVCAAQLLVSSGEASRMQSEASFAALAGTSPVDASSGKQQRHRLNHGGDRQLNWALPMIALQPIQRHAPTASYHQRLLAKGKTRKEARRCIKRALARHFYHQLQKYPLTT